MAWATWIQDPEVQALERALNAIGTTVIEGEEFVRIGSFSRTKIFDVETFKRTANAILNGRPGGGPDARGRRGRGADRDGAAGAGVSLADIERANATAHQLAALAIAERDEWRARALNAEASLAGSAAKPTSATKPDVERVKRLLARELHPDAASDEAEKRLRSDLFQKVWPLIEQL
jgi:hypothetical protein